MSATWRTRWRCLWERCWRGGYAPAALGESVAATLTALDGAGEAESAAPEQILTPRAASRLGHQ